MNPKPVNKPLFIIDDWKNILKIDEISYIEEEMVNKINAYYILERMKEILLMFFLKIPGLLSKTYRILLWTSLSKTPR